MKITDLLNRAGDKVKTQRLDKSFVGMKSKKSGTEITFATTEEMAQGLARQCMTGQPSEYIGFVVWIPKDCFDK